MLGEVFERVAVVLENEAVATTFVNAEHLGNRAVVEVESEHVGGWDVDEAEPAVVDILGNVLVKQNHAWSALAVHQEFLHVNGKGVGDHDLDGRFQRHDRGFGESTHDQSSDCRHSAVKSATFTRRRRPTLMMGRLPWLIWPRTVSGDRPESSEKRSIVMTGT